MSREEELNIVGQMAVAYSEQPVLQSLLSLVPCWGSADILIQQLAEEIHRNRIRIFFDELARGEREITSEDLENNDFLHCFLTTTRAVLRTRREEKVKLFARLLVEGHKTGVTRTDEYEEHLCNLDELSLKEFGALCLLHSHPCLDYEASSPDKPEIGESWDKFKSQLDIEYGVGKSEIGGFLNRLMRTGCIAPSSGLSFNNIPIMHTTPQFGRLHSLLCESSLP